MGWDSNPRGAVHPCRFSSPAPMPLISICCIRDRTKSMPYRARLCFWMHHKSIAVSQNCPKEIRAEHYSLPARSPSRNRLRRPRRYRILQANSLPPARMREVQKLQRGGNHATIPDATRSRGPVPHKLLNTRASRNEWQRSPVLPDWEEGNI